MAIGTIHIAEARSLGYARDDRIMKVLFVLENTMKDLQGGTEVSSWHLATLLRKKGVKAEEWAPFGKRRDPFWYTNIFSQMWIAIVLSWKLMKDRVQIIHIQGKYLIPPTVLVGRLFHIPTVATVRDYIVVCPIGLCLFDQSCKGPTSGIQGKTLIDYRHSFVFFIKKEIPRFFLLYHSVDNLIIRMIRYIFLLRGWFVTLWLQFWLKQADAVISVSEAVQKILYENGISSKVIYNSFDTKFLKNITQRSTLNAQRSTILFVGKPSYGKGHDLFLALSRMEEFRQYKFKTIGGSTKLGYEDTLKEIGQALAVIVPSRWPEPFGRVALEALMLGTPVIASRCGGLTEIVSDSKTGILVEPIVEDVADALRLIIKKNKKFRDEIISRKEQLTEKFESMPLKLHIDLYIGLLDRIGSR